MKLFMYIHSLEAIAHHSQKVPGVHKRLVSRSREREWCKMYLICQISSQPLYIDVLNGFNYDVIKVHFSV